MERFLIETLASLFGGMVLFIAFVAGSGVFPQPLDKDEEAECLKRLAAGDKKARATLIERNLRLVAHIVKKFDNTGEDPDDLISIGTIGLIKAVNTFDPSKQTRLATYAARCIENEILMQLRANKRTRYEQKLQDPIGADKEGNEITLIDVLPSDEDVLEQVELSVSQERMREKIHRLTRRERKVLEMRYGLADGVRKTQREISRLLGISRSYVSRIEKRAIDKLHEAMTSER